MHMQRTNIHVYHLSSRSSETRLSCPVKHSAYIAIGLLLRNNATSLWTTGMRKKIGSTNHWILKLFSQSFGMDKDFAKCQFWDPTDEYLLPERCPHCRKIVSATELEEQNSDAVVMQMYCPHCSSEYPTNGPWRPS